MEISSKEKTLHPSKLLKTDIPSTKKVLKKSIYQMQRPLNLSLVKPQNSWLIYKKMTILISMPESDNSSINPLTKLDFLKELAPKTFEDLKENLSDISMDFIKTPIPFLTTLKTPKNQELELRYLLTSEDKGFSLESRDFELFIHIVSLKKDTFFSRFYLEKTLAIVLLTENVVNSQQNLYEKPEIGFLTFIFDLNNLKTSFEGLKVFINARIVILHEKRIENIENYLKITVPFDKLPVLKVDDINNKEIALNFALLINAKEKKRYMKNLYFKLGSPPENLFISFRKVIEKMSLGFATEILAKKSYFSKKKKTTQAKSTYFVENHHLTRPETKEISSWALEKVIFNQKDWKNDLFLMLGCPKAEKILKTLFFELDSFISSKKNLLHKKFSDLYSQNDQTRVIKPVFHLKHLSSGYQSLQTKDLTHCLAIYLVNHKHYSEIQKESLKILLGNPRASLKDPRKASELKLLESTLLGELKRISDQRTSYNYLQQEQNPFIYKENLLKSEEFSILKSFEQRSFVKILVLYDEKCEKSIELVKNSVLSYRNKEGVLIKLSLLGINTEILEGKKLKSKVLKEKPIDILFLVSVFSLDTIKNSLKILNSFKISINRWIVYGFKGIFDFSGENMPFFNYIEEVNGLDLKGLVGIIINRSENIVRKGILLKKLTVLNDSTNFFKDLNDYCDPTILKELFEGFSIERAQNINEIEEIFEKALLRLDSAISKRELKAFELKKKLEIMKNSSFQGIFDHLALKLIELSEFNGKKANFYVLYAGNKTPLKELKTKLKEKMLFPIIKGYDLIEIIVLSDNSVVLEHFKVQMGDLQKKKIPSDIVNSTITMEIKMKMINLEEETYKINRKRLEKLEMANFSLLQSLFQFKYDFMGYLRGKSPKLTDIDTEQQKQNRLTLLRQAIIDNEFKIDDLKTKILSVTKEKEVLEETIPIKEGKMDITHISNIQQRENRLKQAINQFEKILEEKKKVLQLETNQIANFNDLENKIKVFFTENNLKQSDLIKLKDYFVHFQKGVLKFYSKALLIEADLFELKKNSKKQLIKSGLAMLAGSVPFIGDILKTVVEKVGEINEKYDEMRLMSKCTKFCVLFASTERLSEILEETAFLLIKDKEKQQIIIGLDGFKDTFWSKIKEKILNFLKKTKEKIFGKGNSIKKPSSLLKEIDTPVKLLANIDSAYICANAAIMMEKDNTMGVFNEQDLYNQRPLVDLFVKLAKEVKLDVYERVLDLHEVKLNVEIEFKGKNPGDIDKEIELYKPKSQLQCTEEIKKLFLEDETNIVKENPVYLVEKNAFEIDLDVLKEKEESLERDLERFQEKKRSSKGVLKSHEDKLSDLERKFNKVEYGTKAKILELIEIKEEATMIEFDANEKIKALTRNAEAIQEKILFYDRYKEILIKRKALK